MFGIRPSPLNFDVTVCVELDGAFIRDGLISSGFALFPELDNHVVLQPPCGPEVSWELHSNQGPAPQGGRPCSLLPASARSYSRSGPSSPPPPSPPSPSSPPGGASRTDTATSPS